jgi:hypothetical protein
MNHNSANGSRYLPHQWAESFIVPRVEPSQPRGTNSDNDSLSKELFFLQRNDFQIVYPNRSRLMVEEDPE